MNTITAMEIGNLSKLLPSEGTIQCVEDLTQETDENKRLIFKFHMKEGQDLNLIYAEEEIPKHLKGILIVIDRTGKSYTKKYWVKNDDTVSFAGGLGKKHHYEEHPNMKPEFSRVIYYSFKNSEIQGGDSNSPSWLNKDANIAYFEF